MGQRRLQNDRPIADVTPLPCTLHHSRSVKKEEVDIAAQVPLCRNSRGNVTDMHKNGQSNIRTGSALPNTTTSFENKALTGTAAISNRMPLNSLHSQNAVTAVIVCHQEEPTTPDEPDVVIAINNTKPLGLQGELFVTETSDSRLAVDSNHSTAEQLTALPAKYAISSDSNKMTDDATRNGTSSYDKRLPGISHATGDSKPKDDSQLSLSAVYNDSDITRVEGAHIHDVSTEKPGHGKSSIGPYTCGIMILQAEMVETVQKGDSTPDLKLTSSPAQGLIWRCATCTLKLLSFSRVYTALGRCGLNGKPSTDPLLSLSTRAEVLVPRIFTPASLRCICATVHLIAKLMN